MYKKQLLEQKISQKIQVDLINKQLRIENLLDSE